MPPDISLRAHPVHTLGDAHASLDERIERFGFFKQQAVIDHLVVILGERRERFTRRHKL